MTGRPNRGGSEGRRRAAALPRGVGYRQHFASLSLPEDWEGRPFLALDFETTGLDSVAGWVVEIGALRFVPREGLGGECMASLVRPGIPIPPEVTAIHGIRDEDVLGSPAFAELAPSLLALAEGTILLAHNAPFDIAFLRTELARTGLTMPNNLVMDTRLLAKAAYPGLPSYRLVDLARHLDLDTGRAHRALDDARTCAALFLAAASRLSGEAQGSSPGVPS